GSHMVHPAPARVRSALCRVAWAPGSSGALTGARPPRNPRLRAAPGRRDRDSTRGWVSNRSLGDSCGRHSDRSCASSAIPVAVCHRPAGWTRWLAVGGADTNGYGLADHWSGLEPRALSLRRRIRWWTRRHALVHLGIVHLRGPLRWFASALSRAPERSRT